MLRPLLLLYNLLLPLLLLASLPRMWRVTRSRGGYGGRFGQRWNRFDAATADRLAALSAQGPLLVHAVSVGEVNVALKWIDALRARRPGTPVVLSTTTTTGHAVATARLGDRTDSAVIFSPLDLPPVVGGLLRRLQPRALVLVEAEVWPNWVWRARRRRVPVFLVNARLSPRSRSRYLRLRALVRPLFDLLQEIHVQEPADADVWRRIGLDPDRIQLCGSIKYDAPDAGRSRSDQRQLDSLRRQLAAAGRAASGPVVLAASTHPGEEAALAAAIRPLADEFAGLQLWIAPRHVERAAEVAAALAADGHTVERRSQWPAAATPETGAPATTAVAAPEAEGALPPAAAPGILMIDTTGELPLWQQLSDVVIIGKSFLGRGGQNPAEAVAAGKPVVTGPHMENFGPLMDRLLGADGIARVDGVSGVAPLVRRWLADPGSATAMAARGRGALAWHHGAALRSVDRVLAAPDGSAAGPVCGWDVPAGG